MEQFKRKHIRDVAMHVDIETREMVRSMAPSSCTNDDQRILYLLDRVRRRG